MKLLNPYRGEGGRWVRGSLHGHCAENSPCGSVPLADGARMYHEIGVDFLAVTDHGVVTDLTSIQAHYPDMVFLPGFEYSGAEHMVFVGPPAADLPGLDLDESLARAGDLLTFCSHPQPRVGQEHWTREKLLALPRLPDGIEVYNGHYGTLRKRAEGCTPCYTHLWDELLTAGLQLWGYANEDFHDPPDFNHAFTVVLVDDPTPEAILRAAKAGRCYATTGLALDRITVSDGHVTVTTAAGCTGRFIGPAGRTLREGRGRRFEYTVTNESYVRFEAAAGHAQLFCQPLFARF